MAAKKPVGARNETVRCENCGEYYATTYKRCPFCEERAADRRGRRDEDEYEDYDVFDDEYDDDYEDDEPRRGGGRRLVTNTRGGGYGRRGPSPLSVILAVLSLALIGAAIWSIVSFIVPIVQRGDPGPVPSVTPSAPVVVSPTPSQDPEPSVDPTAEPSVEPTQGPGDVDVSPSPAPGGDIPASQTATAFTLVNYAGKTIQDISLSDSYPDFTFRVSFSPSGSTGSITWESSKPEVVAVDQNGKLTPVSKGSATITATMAGGYSQSCVVRNNVTTGGGSVTPAEPSASTEPGTSSSSLSLNVGKAVDGNGYDFSLPVGDAWTLKVKGASGTPTWSVKDSSIATVDGSGRVTAVSKGNTTITVTVDGQTLTCLVRCT